MKSILLIILAALAFSTAAAEEKPNIFKAVVSLQVLCTLGGPAELMGELLESYNEKPVHGMDISTESGLNIQMYITENRNNPTSTVLLHNQNVDKTCIFWSAKDYLRTLEVDSLPAKTPMEEENI